jgi:uncharacterized protein (DUF1810 family)
MTEYKLQRFHKAQEQTYHNAFSEIRNGKKTSHWMWFIFPQIAGLGFSEISKFYAIRDLREAELYLKDDILAGRLISINKLLLEIRGKTAHEIFGSPDDSKLKSSMTLFSSVKDANPIFQQVLDHYFNGNKDAKTLQLIKRL